MEQVDARARPTKEQCSAAVHSSSVKPNRSVTSFEHWTFVTKDTYLLNLKYVEPQSRYVKTDGPNGSRRGSKKVKVGLGLELDPAITNNNNNDKKKESAFLYASRLYVKVEPLLQCNTMHGSCRQLGS